MANYNSNCQNKLFQIHAYQSPAMPLSLLLMYMWKESGKQHRNTTSVPDDSNSPNHHNSPLMLRPFVRPVSLAAIIPTVFRAPCPLPVQCSFGCRLGCHRPYISSIAFHTVISAMFSAPSPTRFGRYISSCASHRCLTIVNTSLFYSLQRPQR